MRQSLLFPKTKKEPPKGAESINHQLLVRAGYIDQLMTGSWTILPLGLRVVEKIMNVIREELRKVDCQEIAMPLLHPKDVWNETGRWDKANDIMYKLKDSREKDFVLSFTHEEIVMDLIRKHAQSYHDFPIGLYQFSTKFRNEPRAKSGILRGREFLMKDAYSAHTSEKELLEYYEKMKEAYIKIFKRLGFEIKITKASGGVFTDGFTHEFQVPCQTGEDTIFWKEGEREAVNEEILDDDKSKYNSSKAIEVGNVFPLGTWYSERMRAYFVNDKGMKKPIWFGSYGIGISRIMGAWVEVSHDDKGIIWNEVLSPFNVHLIELPGGNGKAVYDKLTKEGFDVLWDDREVGAGEKFSDADLIGIPIRLVVSEKSGHKIEWKDRGQDQSNLLEYEEVISRLNDLGVKN